MTSSPAAPDRGAAPARTLFFGSGGFAVPILEALLTVLGIRVVAVVTTPDRPAGRDRGLASTPVARRAAELELPLLRPPSLRTPDAEAAIARTRPQLAVLADYGRLVPPAILALPPAGFLNLHPSLLPRHRGATPVAATILGGDDEAGVTLFRMDAGLDTGPIVSQVRWPLGGDETAETLERAAAVHAADLLVATLPGWLGGDRATTPQQEDEASVTRPFRKDDGRLDPAIGAVGLERRVRALRPWPGTFFETPDARIGVFRAAVERSEAGDPRGTLVAAGDGLAIATPDGRLRLVEVQPAGGKRMSGADLRRGRPGLVGQPLVGAPAMGRSLVGGRP